MQSTQIHRLLLVATSMCGEARAPVMNTSKFLALTEFQEAIHKGKTFSKSLLPTTYELKTPSSTRAWRNMSPTPVSTWTIIQGVSSMHDIFACSQSLHKQVHDCQALLHGVASNHRAVRLKLILLSIKFKALAISRGTINWPKLLSDNHT